MKRTPWLDGAVKPFHKGVYERRTPGGRMLRSYWNGKKWMLGSPFRPVEELRKERIASRFQMLEWCGLANPEHDRRNIGPVVSMLANANPKWSHRKVLDEAKIIRINEQARMVANRSSRKRPKGTTSNG